jgi:uncharacterized YigZ family protein
LLRVKTEKHTLFGSKNFKGIKNLKKIDTYFTLKELSEGLYKEKGSKFIAYAVPCFSEADAKVFLQNWKKEHHQARHVCYAYRFGLDKSVFRANDDGEPSNSAGQPILGQIQSFDLTNILIGVVRYFGGTKLGVGGLITAYKTAAKEAIENGEIVEKHVFQNYRLSFQYDSLPQIMTICKHLNLTQSNQQFDSNCSLTIAVPLNDVSLLLENTKFINVEFTDLGIY